MNLEIETHGWPAGAWPALAERTAAAVATIDPALANPRLETSALLTNDARVHQLNREWRQRDKPTNVLSFPMLARDALEALDADGPPVLFGDIALAYETCAREAADKGISLADHTAHLIVHGLLHLAGYDHETSAKDAEKMEACEIAALAQMGVDDPYKDGQLTE